MKPASKLNYFQSLFSKMQKQRTRQNLGEKLFLCKQTAHQF